MAGHLCRVLAWLLTLGFTTAAGASESSALPERVSFPVCYDFTCRTQETVTLSEGHWNSVAILFAARPASAREERLAIQKAIARMEQLVGFHTPTYRDLPRNYTGEDDAVASLPGQMDCVDESINTNTYLEVFQQQGLLAHHRVVPRAYRRALLNQHWAGQVEELAGGDRYVVDSWFLENGRQPYIVHSDDWHDISPFRSARFLPGESPRRTVAAKNR